jgi:hypothetical protein
MMEHPPCSQGERAGFPEPTSIILITIPEQGLDFSDNVEHAADVEPAVPSDHHCAEADAGAKKSTA